jgi:quinohemoprotein ethanol dehydrogenase
LKDAALVKPSAEGAHNWNPISFNPTTGLVYLAVLEDTSLHAIIPHWKINLHDQTTGSDRAYRGPAREEYLKIKNAGRLVAWDPVAQKEAWHVDLPDPKSGGTLSTAGNLVFQGRADGKLSAYRATDGKPLWEFDAGVGITAPPMTFSVDGVQYIAVQSGWGGPQVLSNRPPGKGHVGSGRLMVFTLGGTATVPPYQHVVRPVPMPTFKFAATKAEIEEGRKVFANTCARCHGGDAISGGSVPDLRYASQATHEMFEEIVLGGARREYGMPSFTGDVTPAQVRLIHAYILDRARESAQADAAKK